MNIEITDKKEYNINHNIFLSSDESETTDKKENNTIFFSSDSSDEKNATNGINIINNTKIHNIKNITNDDDSSNSISEKNNDNINGWDLNANTTITNWYTLFKQQSFIYQWILERNQKISNKLTLASIISSSILGIFAGFKLWIHNDTFEVSSNLLLMLSNFSVALITSYSKSYIDDKRNELIRIYIDEIDELLGEISAQVITAPAYRTNARDFFKDHNYKYTKLITYLPNISIYELNECIKEYEKQKS